MCYFYGFTQKVKKNRDPRWDESFEFTLDEPPTNDKIHVEVVSSSSRTLLHGKVETTFSASQGTKAENIGNNSQNRCAFEMFCFPLHICRKLLVMPR